MLLLNRGRGIKFRGHHLICLHFFQGEGYNAEFIKNLITIMKMVKDGDIEIHSGADDICRKCPYLHGEICKYNENAQEEITEMDERALQLLRLKLRMKVKWEEIRGRLQGIFPEWYISYCKDCDWKTVCEQNESFDKLSHTLLSK